MSTNTRWTVLKYMLETYSLGRRIVNDGDQASITQISDDSQLGGRRGDSVEVGCDVRIRQNSVAADSGSNTYGEARVATRPTLSAGLITFDPAPSSAAVPENIDKDDNYTEALILDLPFRWEDACNYINAAMTELVWEKRMVPLTNVPDGDMLASGTSNYTASGATATKTAGSFGVPHRYMAISGSGSSEYVETNSISVEQGVSYYLEIRAAKTGSSGGDGTLSLQDVTNSTALTLSSTSIDERVPIILAQNVTMGSTTEQVAVRLAKANGSNNHLAWLYVILRRNSDRTFTIQDRPAKLLWLGELRATVGTAQRSFPEMRPVPAKAVQVDTGIWQYQLQENMSGYSLWYEEFVQPTLMDSDDDTTSIEVEDLAAVATEMLLRQVRSQPKWQAVYERAAVASARVRQERLAALRSSRQSSQYRISPLTV